jgi:hypothetical protein
MENNLPFYTAASPLSAKDKEATNFCFFFGSSQSVF